MSEGTCGVNRFPPRSHARTWAELGRSCAEEGRSLWGGCPFRSRRSSNASVENASREPSDVSLPSELSAYCSIRGVSYGRRIPPCGRASSTELCLLTPIRISPGDTERAATSQLKITYDKYITRGAYLSLTDRLPSISLMGRTPSQTRVQRSPPSACSGPRALGYSAPEPPAGSSGCLVSRRARTAR
jgi:hypothetical protein